MSNSKPLPLDRLHRVTPHQLKTYALLSLNLLQRRRPQEIVAAIAAVFILLCRRYKVDPRGVLDTVDTMVRHASEEHPVEMRALKRYLREDLPDA